MHDLLGSASWAETPQLLPAAAFGSLLAPVGRPFPLLTRSPCCMPAQTSMQRIMAEAPKKGSNATSTTKATGAAGAPAAAADAPAAPAGKKSSAMHATAAAAVPLVAAAAAAVLLL